MRVGKVHRTAGTNAVAAGASWGKQYILVEEPGIIVPLSTLQVDWNLNLGSLCVNNVDFF